MQQKRNIQNMPQLIWVHSVSRLLLVPFLLLLEKRDPELWPYLTKFSSFHISMDHYPEKRQNSLSLEVRSVSIPLMKVSAGTSAFLLRNSSVRACFAMTVYQHEPKKEVTHLLIYPRSQGGYSIQVALVITLNWMHCRIAMTPTHTPLWWILFLRVLWSRFFCFPSCDWVNI